ncbi:hypothetical protein D3C86_1853590 [compost metagenome]
MPTKTVVGVQFVAHQLHVGQVLPGVTAQPAQPVDEAWRRIRRLAPELDLAWLYLAPFLNGRVVTRHQIRKRSSKLGRTQ